MRTQLKAAGIGAAALTALLLTQSAARAQIAAAAIDTRVKLVNGVVTVLPNPAPEYLAILDLKTLPPKVVAEIPVATSFQGPPFSVAISPDQSLALVTASNKIDPADPTKLAPGDTVSVIDLKASPPAVIARLKAGKQPTTVAFSPLGNLALVSNFGDGTVSVFTVNGKDVKLAGNVMIGDEKSGPYHVMFAPDGKTALVTRSGDHRISVLSIAGTKVEYTKRDMFAGLRPFAVDIGPKGDMAVVSNIGMGTGDADTFSVIDLKATPPRVVDTISLGGMNPEGIRLSPDGKLCAVAIQNGSQKAPNSPFFNESSRVILYRVDGLKLTRLSDAPTGLWSQGAEFTPDSKGLIVGNMGGQGRIYRIEGGQLKDAGALTFRGGAASIRGVDHRR
jgi:DNA-binding beta-propeller fold protein YncE